MLKTFALIVRRPDVSREDFRRHYEEVHSPLAVPVLEGLLRYAKYHVEEEWIGEAPFDVVSGFWYPSGEAALATLRRLEGPDGEPIRRDERSFMDVPRNRFFPVAEERRVGDEEGDRHLFFFLAGAGAEGALPRLTEALGTPAFALDHRVLGDAPWQRVIQWRGDPAPDRDALAAWAGAEERRGARVLAIGTRLFETEPLRS